MRTKVLILQHKRLNENSFFQYNFESKLKTAPIFLSVQ